MPIQREKLIAEIKAEYARIASQQSQAQSVQATNHQTPEMYYERLLDTVLAQADAGVFDSFTSGREVVEAVANNRQKWLPA